MECGSPHQSGLGAALGSLGLPQLPFRELHFSTAWQSHHAGIGDHSQLSAKGPSFSAPLAQRGPSFCPSHYRHSLPQFCLCALTRSTHPATSPPDPLHLPGPVSCILPSDGSPSLSRKGARHPVLSWPDQAPLASGLAGIWGPREKQVELPSRSPLDPLLPPLPGRCSQQTPLWIKCLYTQKPVAPNKALCTEHS